MERALRCQCGNYDYNLIEKKTGKKVQMVIVCQNCKKRTVVEVF